ncbi:hypothetical protein MA16_Dca017894 [Dendrobium catenatum]|uniref:Uncharacterized protein n=1 Tax=Dendrobium catenatum TaxID=906689 RepID=A0A2I0W9R9_9ASPA|nr:hypothetical protein MA16_Dca017894 [Dendrobium catenatum]
MENLKSKAYSIHLTTNGSNSVRVLFLVGKVFCFNQELPYVLFCISSPSLHLGTPCSHHSLNRHISFQLQIQRLYYGLL